MPARSGVPTISQHSNFKFLSSLLIWLKAENFMLELYFKAIIPFTKSRLVTGFQFPWNTKEIFHRTEKACILVINFFLYNFLKCFLSQNT